MKRKVVIMLFCMCIGAFSVGCSSDVFDQVTEEVTGLIDGSNSDDEEVEDIEVKEESEETSEEDSPKAEGKLKKDAVETITDGIYSSYLIASKKDEAGVPDETGAQQKIVYASELSDDVFCIVATVTAKMHHRMLFPFQKMVYFLSLSIKIQTTSSKAEMADRKYRRPMNSRSNSPILQIQNFT